jgi:hypothetical protein
MPDGFPIWVSPVRLGREHGTTCAKVAADLLPGLVRPHLERDCPCPAATPRNKRLP